MSDLRNVILDPEDSPTHRPALTPPSSSGNLAGLGGVQQQQQQQQYQHQWPPQQQHQWQQPQQQPYGMPMQQQQQWQGGPGAPMPYQGGFHQQGAAQQP